MELLSSIKHQTAPSIGPGRTDGRIPNGIRACINSSRVDDSVANEVKRASVGESWVA
jgi:hypothetical protein